MMMSIYLSVCLSVCLSGVYGNYQTSQRDYDSMNVTIRAQQKETSQTIRHSKQNYSNWCIKKLMFFNTKISSASGVFVPCAGALPMDPAGGSAPRPPF